MEWAARGGRLSVPMVNWLHANFLLH